MLAREWTGEHWYLIEAFLRLAASYRKKVIKRLRRSLKATKQRLCLLIGIRQFLFSVQILALGGV